MKISNEKAKQLIEDIISMPSGEEAGNYAWSVRYSMKELFFLETLDAELNKSEGDRQLALSRLMEYRTAVLPIVSNDLLTFSPPRNLPKLSVVQAPKDLFEEKLKQYLPDWTPSVKIDINTNLPDYLQKSDWYGKIQSMGMKILTRERLGGDYQALLKDILYLEQQCHELLAITEDGERLYSRENVMGELAAYQRSAARTYEAMGDMEKAATYLNKALHTYTELNRPSDVQLMREKLAGLKETQKGNVDEEKKRLEHSLSGIEPYDLGYIDKEIQLAWLNYNVGDLFQAKKLFDSAKTKLDKNYGSKIQNVHQDIVDTLSAFINPNSESFENVGNIEEVDQKMRVRGLYKTLYSGLSKVYHEEGNNYWAQIYLDKEKALD